MSLFNARGDNKPLFPNLKSRRLRFPVGSNCLYMTVYRYRLIQTAFIYSSACAVERGRSVLAHRSASVPTKTSSTINIDKNSYVCEHLAKFEVPAHIKGPLVDIIFETAEIILCGPKCCLLTVNCDFGMPRIIKNTLSTPIPKSYFSKIYKLKMNTGSVISLKSNIFSCFFSF